MQTLLPIHTVLPELKSALVANDSVILQADPGAGKTTVVPLELLNESWLKGQKVVMLEPRRLAARAAAQRMAETLGERVGQTVGYRMKGETKVGPNTRVEVVTEGVLTRMLQSDPELGGVGLVIFDEFHERSLQADLGLALVLQAREVFREDLKVLVMSATLEGIALKKVLPNAQTVQSAGRSYPVSLRYLSPSRMPPMPANLPEAVAEATLTALKENEGSVLVFLPGVKEIRRAEALIRAKLKDPTVRIAPLYGAMEAKAQRLAVQPAPEGERKVVLATNIAETSLTIEGVQVVIDGGYARRVRFDAKSGMNRYETLPVSQQSAIQRAGRAGRTAPGVCYRLWHETKALIKAYPPEILTADLAPLLLELAVWGANAKELGWIDPPPEHALKSAETILISFNMIDKNGLPTPYGEEALTLGLHPRLAHMVLKAKARGALYEALLLAVLLQEGTVHGDLTEAARTLHQKIVQKVQDAATRAARKLMARLGADAKDFDADRIGPLTGLAYPERIAKRRGKGSAYLSAGGKGLIAPEELARHEWLAVAEAGGEGEPRVFAAAPLNEKEIEAWFGDLISETEEVVWREASGRVEAKRVRRLGVIILQSRPVERPDPEKIKEALLRVIAQKGLDILPWDKRAQSLRLRAECVETAMPGTLPRFDDETLLKTLSSWLGPYLDGIRSLEALKKLNFYDILSTLLGYEGLKKLDSLAPERLKVPGGSRVAVDYSDPIAPVLPVKLQEMFGQTDTPAICDGRVTLTLHLLSPAGRPLAVTRDLRSFWQNAYPDVRKDMRGRYPKHPWPEDPLTAMPTGKTKKRLRA